MSLKGPNIFEEATELISLDCSAITGQNITISRNISHSLHQSILNLKTVLPTFTAQYAVFKEQIMEMTYYIVNKLMNVIKSKNLQVVKLEDDLIKSQSLTNIMKKQVIQLKQMITEFMQSYSKQIQIKQKEINQKQKQLTQLKTVLQQNFNSPTNLCQNCHSQSNQMHTNIQLISSTKENTTSLKQNGLFFQNYGNKGQILIEMSESIVCDSRQNQKRTSLEIIQQQSSDINSLTDYLYSQRYSQNPDKDIASKQISEAAKSQRSGICQQNQRFYTGKGSQKQLKFPHLQQKNFVHLTQYQKTIKDFSPLRKNNVLSSDMNLKQNFSSRVTNKNPYINDVNRSQIQRRSSEHIVSANSLYDGYKIQRKSIQRILPFNRNIQNLNIHINDHQKNFIQYPVQQLSKSSSLSEILHFGDTDKININLPKKLQSPRKMNFIQNSSRQKRKEQRIKTQPSPRDDKFQINKENINVDFSLKPVQMGRKIFARKKTIMTHAKPNHTSRLQSKGESNKDLKKQKYNQNDLKMVKNDDNSRKIEIKYIQSPQKAQSKSSHLLKPSGFSIFSANNQTGNQKNYALYSSVTSNISNINQSVVRSHHEYHSTGKYQQNGSKYQQNGSKYQQNGECINSRYSVSLKKSTSVMTPKQKPYDRKSNQKSKEKLKVTSKNSEGSKPKSQQKQKRKALTQMMNQNNFMPSSNSNSFSKVKIKPKNLSVHFGSSSNRIHLKQKLNQIKNALKSYDIQNYLSQLAEVFYEGKYQNGYKEGQGKIVYDNGLIYQGVVKNGKRQGEAKFILNGIDVYEGLFANDHIEGQGYLKFLRYLSATHNCPQPLQDASYFGKFINNKFDGMGTLFLNQKQKIVTKFSNGIPYGQLTFYTQNDIEFGHWSNE